jgi:hypothetical protein
MVYYNVLCLERSVEPTTDAAGNEGNNDVSTLIAATKRAFRFTSYSKGSRKYEGWNSAGVGFYNELVSLVEKRETIQAAHLNVIS